MKFELTNEGYLTNGTVSYNMIDIETESDCWKGEDHSYEIDFGLGYSRTEDKFRFEDDMAYLSDQLSNNDYTLNDESFVTDPDGNEVQLFTIETRRAYFDYELQFKVTEGPYIENYFDNYEEAANYYKENKEVDVFFTPVLILRRIHECTMFNGEDAAYDKIWEDYVGCDDEVDWNEIKEIIFENGWDWYNDVDEVPEKMIDQLKAQYQKWQKESNDEFEKELAEATGKKREFLLKIKNGEYRK